MFFEFFLAFRFLKARKKKSLFSKFSLLSIISISFSLSISIISLSVINGFHKIIMEKISSLNFHIQLKPSSNLNLLENWKSIFNFLEKDTRILYFKGFFEKQALIYVNKNSNPIIQEVFIRSYLNNDFKKDLLFSNLLFITKTLENSEDLDFSFKNNHNVILSEFLADKLNLNLGDSIELLIPEGNLYTDFHMKTKKKFIISKIYNANFYLSNPIIFIPFESIGIFFSFKAIPNRIGIFLKNPITKDDLISDIKLNFPNIPIQDYSKEETIKNLSQEKLASKFFTSILIILSSLSIYATIYSFLMDKHLDFLILKNLGINAKKIRNINLILSNLICLIGISLGNVIGIIAVRYLESLVFFIEKLINFIKKIPFQIAYFLENNKINSKIEEFKIVNSEIFYLEGLPYQLNLEDLIFLSLISWIVSFIASYKYISKFNRK